MLRALFDRLRFKNERESAGRARAKGWWRDFGEQEYCFMRRFMLFCFAVRPFREARSLGKCLGNKQLD